jgi:polyhydroxybutyrate depolymerase
MKILRLFLILLVFGCQREHKDDALNIFRFDNTMTADGIERLYTVNLPPNYYQVSSTSFSLVLALHGGGGSSSQFESTNKLTEKANASGFIVVYPNGMGLLQTWNAGACCGYAMNNSIDDVNFISKLIDKLVADYRINPKKVYATGHSNGGMMCYRLACELGDKIAAIAPNGCTMVATSCDPARPMPILHMHSKLDEHVPYLGGVGNGVTGIDCTPIDEVLEFWSGENGCVNEKQLVSSNSSYSVFEWTGCDESKISYYLTEDGGHGWPGGLPGGPNADTPSIAINANDLLWDFFQKYQLR